MAGLEISTRRLAISKANGQMVGAIAAASFIVIFCLVASHAVLSQYRYQGKVVKAKQEAHNTLKANLAAFDSLVSSYKAFDAADSNVIGGSKTGTGDNDGPNSKIILDALPSSYDFPALTSSVEKLMKQNGLKVSSINGVDDQVNQQANLSSPNPAPVPMPFSFTVTNASYDSVQTIVKVLQQSIRPIQVDSIDLTGGMTNMSLTVNAHTYYQPGKSVNITTKVIK